MGLACLELYFLTLSVSKLSELDKYKVMTSSVSDISCFSSIQQIQPIDIQICGWVFKTNLYIFVIASCFEVNTRLKFY